MPHPQDYRGDLALLYPPGSVWVAFDAARSRFIADLGCQSAIWNDEFAETTASETELSDPSLIVRDPADAGGRA
jgi:hypothetical protein